MRSEFQQSQDLIDCSIVQFGRGVDNKHFRDRYNDFIYQVLALRRFASNAQVLSHLDICVWPHCQLSERTDWIGIKRTCTCCIDPTVLRVQLRIGNTCLRLDHAAGVAADDGVELSTGT